jgi:hypothetical protein
MIVRTLVKFRPHESFKALAKEADPQGANFAATPALATMR